MRSAIDQGKKVPGRVMISNGANFEGENFTRFIPEIAMNFATVKPRYPNNCISDATKIADWVERQHSFVPPHVQFRNRKNQKLVLLTRKAEFLKKINEFKPAPIRDLVDSNYFSSSSKCEPICVRRHPGDGGSGSVFKPRVTCGGAEFKSFDDDWLKHSNIVLMMKL